MAHSRTKTTRVGRAILIVVLLTGSLLLPGFQVVRQIDERLVAYRFQSAPRIASQQLVFVAIDKRSLDEVGTWPWPRSVHAQLVDQLIASGVRDIFLDIDFSTPSNDTQDRRLAKSLSDAGGGVILPVFTQRPTAAANSEPVLTRPISALSDMAWLASANVKLDDDGLVRHFELGAENSGAVTQSVASVLAKSALSSGFLPIDFSIQPATVPTYSVSDVLSGRIARRELQGRSIVVGAYATELKDTFAVPVYGALSGPMINILGAETLIQHRLLREVDMMPFQLLLAGIIIVGALALRNRPIALAFATAGILGVSIEVIAFYVQKDDNLLLPTSTCWIMLLVGLFLVMNEQLDLSGLIADFANAEQRNTRRLLHKVVEDSADAVIVFDHSFKVVERSESATTLFGPGICEPHQVLQKFAPTEVLISLRSLVSDRKHHPTRSHSAVTEFLFPTAEAAGHFEANVTLSPVEADRWAADVGSFVGCLTIRNVTARELYQKKLQQLAEIDELTGLLNRREFTNRLAALHGLQCVVAVDLHRFSVLNGTLGRAMGDDLLRAVGQRLSSMDGADLVGNFGGNLFCITLKMSGNQSAAERVVRLLDLIEEPFALGRMIVQTTARAGFCESHLIQAEAHHWIEAAEQALDEAKAVAGRGWSAYDPSVAQRQARSRQLERDMRQGLANGEFYLLYQPQVDLRSGKITGAEALIRWQHPELGLVSPLEFVAIAEANGFICDIGRFVLLEACREAATWPEYMSVAVNVSSIQFAKSDIVSDVYAAIETTGLEAHRLHLEITESAFVSRTDQLIRSLTEFRERGIIIALDDFGTGYSSLSYIASFPLDKLKIDQSFIKKMPSDPGSQAIVQAVCTLAHSLHLDIVAEGIETELEWRLLGLVGCQYGQGYFFGKPQSAQQLLSLSDYGLLINLGTESASQHAG